MVLPHITITPIPDTEPDATPDLWNTRYSEIDENFAAIDTAIESLSSSGTVDTLSATVAGHTAWITEHDTLIHSLSATLTALSETVALHIAGGGGGGGTVTLPATPTITSPAANATGMSLTQTITLSAFSNTDSDAYATTVAEISTTSDFATLAIPAITATSGASVAVPSGLSNSTTYYLRVKYTDSGGHASAYSSAVVFTTVAVSVIIPSVSIQFDVTEYESLTPSFRVTVSEEIQSATYYVSPDYAFNTSTAEWTDATVRSGVFYIPVPAGAMTYKTTHYVSAKVTTADGRSSDFAIPAWFTPVGYPSTPTITSPADNETGVSLTPQIAFTFPPVAADGDVSNHIQIQIDTDNLFNTLHPVWQFDNIVASPISYIDGYHIAVSDPAVPLLPNTQYYIHAQAIDSGGHWGAWSTPTTFTTGAS